MSKFRTTIQVKKMIVKMENSKLNIIPISKIGHIRAVGTLRFILFTKPSMKWLIQDLKQDKRILRDLKKKQKRRFTPQREVRIYSLEGVVEAYKWYMKLDDSK